MNSFPKIEKQSLSQQVKDVLLRMMKEDAFRDTGKLPSEEKLAEILGVSRSVIRDVLILFETKGFITRRRGIGTIINRHVLNVNTRLDLELEFLDLIRESGYKPAIRYVNIYDKKAEGEVCKKLRLEAGEDIYIVERLVTADGIPAIYCIDHFSKKLIKEEYDEAELKAPVFKFLKERCNVTIDNDLTQVEPVCVDEAISKIMDVQKGQPILYLDEVGYDIEQNPVLWSREYHRSDLLKYTLFRKKI